MTFLIPVIGMLCTTLLLLLLYPRRGKLGKLDALYSVESAKALSSLDPKSLEYKLLAAGFHMRPATFRLLRVAVGGCGAALGWLLLPGIPALIIGGILFFLPGAWLDDRLKQRGREIDRLLPIAIGRVAAGLLAGGSAADVLQQVGESLAAEKPNPLSLEFSLTASEMRTKDREEALQALAARSPSVSLANLAQLLEGYTQAGGGAYALALGDISTRVQQILSARGRAQARAGDALVSARVLPVVLFGVLAYLSQDPGVHAAIGALPVQIVIGVSMGAMLGGYLLMRSMIREAV